MEVIPCRLSLVVPRLKTPILNCFYHLLMFYFLTDTYNDHRGCLSCALASCARKK